MSRITVVVGSGSAGGIVAARLSEDPEEQVILLEAGPDYPTDESLPASLRDVYNPQLEGHDWGFQANFLEPVGDRPQVPYPRGRVLGGSSSVNGAYALRGTPQDFEEWVSLGNPEWAWERVLPFYKRLENDLDFGETEVHGGSGPIPITRKTREEWTADQVAFVQACQDLGYPWVDDMVDPANGVGPAPRNQVGEQYRASTMVTYLREARSRPNLEIRGDALVARVVFAGTRAVGVEVVTVDGGRERIDADQIVLSGGSIGTPKILTLSGVGPQDALDRLGIEPVVVSPGVGRNLRDHIFAPVVAVPKADGEGLYGFRVNLKYDSGGPFPNDQFVVAAYLDATSMNFEVDIDSAVMLCALVGKPSSVGWLEVTSADPAALPDIHLNFLDTEEDMTKFKHVTRTAHSIATETVMADELSQVLFPDAATVASDERLEEWLRLNVATGYHGAGTCRMGPDGDDGAVVNERLAVRGTEGLYVADASVMPNLTTAMTNVTCFMIGERLASWLRGEAFPSVATPSTASV